MSITDQAQRQSALDPRQSFIVQAPAGSGKTELLIQRFLTLLATVQQPEEILSITFTRKAASEMRERIMCALNKARNQAEPSSAHEKQTWRLAKMALAQNDKLNWQLLKNPSRLRTQTIDALCASITRQLPILSRFGTQPQVCIDPSPLYQKAAREILSQIDSPVPWSDAVQTVLLHLDNNQQLVEDLLINMLRKRDHWLRYVLQNNLREELEAGLLVVNEETIEDLAQQIPEHLKKELFLLAGFAEGNLISPLSQGEGGSNRNTWLRIAELLTTKDNQWRSQINKRIGFPAPSSASNETDKTLFAEMKERLKQLIESLKNHRELLPILSLIKILPPETYTDKQWEFLKALFQVLPILSAQLQVIFSQVGQVDFTEISSSALTALGDAENPTDLALALDYRIQHILVDEFQDTAITQLQLLETLTAGWEIDDGRTLFIVGDPMQSIYRFRNAEVSLFLRARIEGIGQINLTPLTLQTNFRSSTEIISWINQRFSDIFPAKEDINLGAVSYSKATPAPHSSDSEGSPKTVTLSPNRETEADHIATLIQQKRSTNPSETIAILVQARSHLSDILPALQAKQIPYQAIDIDYLTTQSHIQDLYALTRALLHFADRIAWLSILRAPWCGLTLNELHLIASDDADTTLWEKLNDLTLIAELSDDTSRRLDRFKQAIKKALTSRQRKPLDVWIHDTWLDLGGPHCLKQITDLNDCDVYFTLLHQLDCGSNLLDFVELKKELNQLFANSDVTQTNPVQIMTIHKSKGLEFDTVILPGLDRTITKQDSQLMLWMERPRLHHGNDLLLAPIKSSREEHDPIYRFLHQLEKQRFDQENRRLFYVAVTRAKKQLILTAVQPVKQELLEDKVTVKKGSFLDYLPRLCHPERGEGSPEGTEEILRYAQDDKGSVRKIHRLSIAQLTSLPSIETAPSGHNQIKPGDLNWHLPIEKHIGILVHRILQQIAEAGLDQWPVERINTEKTHWQAYLQQNGIKDPKALQLTETAIQNTLTDEKGRWILSPHQKAHSEFELSTIENRQTKHYIIDRCFIDETNQLWVIDYKTSSHNQEPYRAQLQTYQRLLAELYQTEARAALYFPLESKFIVVL